ncbi:MAG: hypothetical protein A2V62_03010 [Nitrospirae bacterium RBG_19FT_COMBO_58_9]|nr:MAG: hypothetical protein A2V62_03010 [Nitrospirae bacterium RBG_19FT_COMBO_58_9]
MTFDEDSDREEFQKEREKFQRKMEGGLVGLLCSRNARPQKAFAGTTIFLMQPSHSHRSTTSIHS